MFLKPSSSLLYISKLQVKVHTAGCTSVACERVTQRTGAVANNGKKYLNYLAIFFIDWSALPCVRFVSASFHEPMTPNDRKNWY